jgi:hypothetical protein
LINIQNSDGMKLAWFSQIIQGVNKEIDGIFIFIKKLKQKFWNLEKESLGFHDKLSSWIIEKQYGKIIFQIEVKS